MDAMPDKRYRMLVLLAAIASLRFGEVTALRRMDVDLDLGSVRVERQLLEITGEGLVEGPVKSAAGRRHVAIPRELVDLPREHMDEYVGKLPDAYLFTTPADRPIRRSSFSGW
jgi:integrase